jgi:predicted transposase YbfD/YdcC
MPNIIQYFRKIHDKRSCRGKRYKLESVLGLAELGFMRGCTSLRAIWKFGVTLNKTDRKRLGFTGEAMPSHPTIINILKTVDPTEFEEVCGKVVRSSSKNQFTHIALDGKSIRSTSDTKNGLLHLVSAFASEISGTLAQIKSDPAGGEITAARHIINQLDIEGKVITADALFAGERFCSEIVAKKGDYLLKIKQNKKRVRDDIIQKLYYHRNKSLPVKSHTTETTKAHGRIESRSIEVIDVTGEQNFGGMSTIKQIAAITRNYCNTKDMKEKSETTYVITSLASDKASPEELLSLNLQHWQIENKLHRPRDVHFKEDVSNVVCHALHQINAAMRNMAIFLLSKIDSSIREAIDKCTQQTSRAISMLLLRI